MESALVCQCQCQHQHATANVHCHKCVIRYICGVSAGPVMDLAQLGLGSKWLAQNTRWQRGEHRWWEGGQEESRRGQVTGKGTGKAQGGTTCRPGLTLNSLILHQLKSWRRIKWPHCCLLSLLRGRGQKSTSPKEPIHWCLPVAHRILHQPRSMSSSGLNCESFLFISAYVLVPFLVNH